MQNTERRTQEKIKSIFTTRHQGEPFFPSRYFAVQLLRSKKIVLYLETWNQTPDTQEDLAIEA